MQQKNVEEEANLQNVHENDTKQLTDRVARKFLPLPVINHINIKLKR